MRIVIDYDRCEGHGRCVELAPQVFAFNDDGQATLLLDDPGEELRPGVERAVALCPRQALALLDEPTSAPPTGNGR
jgi:ferredoxin